MKRYSKDPHYFLKYFVANVMIFAALCGALGYLHPLPQMSWSALAGGGLWSALIVLGGIVFGLVVSTAFHNASHGNIKPRWLNTAVGELTGAYTLEGMRNFRVGHTLHHRHSDDPDLDPHPPGNQGFWRFLLTSRQRTIACLKTVYVRHHGDTAASRRNIGLQMVAFNAGFVLKALFWFLVFGPSLFLLFFVPSYLAYVLGFGHLNWAAHYDDGTAADPLRNHSGTLYYDVMNVITAGGYFHKDHHRSPWLYNPRRRPEAGLWRAGPPE